MNFDLVKLGKTASVLFLALAMAGCGGGSDNTDDTAAMEREAAALAAAQSAADMAADAAEMAADAAEGAVAAQSASMDADAASYGVANNAAMRARAAATAARAASDAAADATDSGAAEAQQAIAVAKRGEAVMEQGNAEMYARMVMDAQTEANNLAAAMTAAGIAADAAEDAADAAEAAAAKVAELAGADSNQAMAANAAAVAARAAATAARNAADMADSATMSADASTHQTTAETQQGTAETQQGIAEELEREAQVASDASGVQNEARDLAAAQEETQDVADEVNSHYMAAKGKADMARAQANAARMAANKAMSARRDYTNANKYAMMAETAADEAEAARDRAMAANEAAMAANTAAMDAATSEEAETQQALAEAANETATEAHTGTTGAGMAYMRAKDAAMKASEASYVNVLALLSFANADGESDTVAREHAIDNVAIALAAAAGTATDHDNDSSTDNGTPDTTAVVTWPGDTIDDPDTPHNEAVTGKFSIALNGITGTTDETEIPFRLEAVPGTPALPQTATKLTHGLPGYGQAYEISSGGGIHAIVFTDKVKGKDSTLAVPVEFGNMPVTNFGRIVPDIQATGGDSTSIDASTVGQLNDTAAYDHDGNPATPALDATFACVPTAECTSFETAGGKVVGVVGDGTFVVSFDGEIPAMAATDSMDYLAFGVWVNEADIDTGEVGTQHGIGAFAAGGQAAGGTGVPAELVGKATYKGSAAGLYTAGDSVDYFHASATLTADFGLIDTDPERDSTPPADTTPGTVKGTIDNIVAGGVSMPNDVITLTSSTITDGAVGAITHMGPATVVGLTASYKYNGTWDGVFYGPGVDDPATARVEGPASTAPKAIAGTFGVSGASTATAATRSYVGAFGARNEDQ